MKRMYFHNINGKTTAVVRNNELITKDGSAIHIKYNVVLQALQMGIFKDRKFAMRSNIYYKVDDRTTILNIKDDEYVLVSTYLRGYSLADILRKKSISIKRTSTNTSRGIARISMPMVRKYKFEGLNKKGTKSKIIEVKKNCSVSFALLYKYIEAGVVNNFSDLVDTVDMEGHHDGAVWDNRSEKIMVMTEDQHTAYHSLHKDKVNNQIVCYINNINELISFIEYVNRY